MRGNRQLALGSAAGTTAAALGGLAARYAAGVARADRLWPAQVEGGLAASYTWAGSGQRAAARSGSPASRWSRAGCRRTRPLRCRPACRRDPDHRPDRDRAGHGGAAATAAHAVLAGYITEQALVVTSAASGWFYERVRSRDPRTAWLQHRADRIWAAPKRGLPPDQDTEAAITATGFRIQARRRFDFQPCLIAAPAGPPILGRAIRE